MGWLAYWDTFIMGLLVADRVAAATPPDFKIVGIPVGRWDNQLVNGIRFLARKLVPLPQK